MRVVSLVPSTTETLLALGADVVACTRFCEQPGLAHVGGTKNPDIEAIVALDPDVVLMDREENRIEDHDALVAHGCRVVVTDVRSVDGALDVVDELAAAVGLPPSGRGRIPPRSPRVRRTAFVPIWRRPWMTIGSQTYGGSLLDHLGIELVTPGLLDAYPMVELADIAERAPQLVLVPSEPYDFSDDHLAELREAFPHATIARVDGQDLFWWGSRTPGAIDRLATRLARLESDTDRHR